MATNNEIEVKVVADTGQATTNLKSFGDNLKSIFSRLKNNSKALDDTGKKMQKLANDTKKASASMSSASKGIGKFGASLKSLATSILPFMTVIGAFNLLKSSTTDAMDAIEDTNMYMAVFGSRAKEMDAWIKQLNKDTGLGIGQTKKFTAIIQQMGSAMGLAGQDAMEMSQSMAKMAGDISSFYNVDITQAQEDLRSALSGSNEVLTKYGIVLRENTIQQFAYANGLARTGSQLTAAQRAMALTLMIEQQLGQANGDLAKTMDTPTGRARRLAVAFEQLKVSLGNIVLPIWNAVMPGLIALANALTAIFNKIASVINGILSLFGMGLKIGGGGGLVDDAQSLGDSLDSAGGGAGDVADNLGSAADSAKQIQKSLMGMDEINNLSAPDSSGGGSGGSGGGAGGGGVGGLDSTVVEETDSFVDSIAEELTRLKDLFRDFLAGFNTTFDASALLQIKEHLLNIKNHLLDIASDPAVQDAFNMMTRQWQMTLGAFVGTLAQIGAQITLGLVGGIDLSLSQNKEHIKQKLVEIFNVKSEIAIEFRKGLYGISEIAKSFGSEEAKQMVANFVTGMTNTSLEFILIGNKMGRDLIHGIAQPIYDNKDAIREAFETTFGFVGDVIKVVMDNVEITLSKFNTFYDEHVKPFVDSFVSGWSEIYGTLLNGYNTYMKPTFDKITGHLQNFYEQYVQPTVTKVLGALGKLFDALKDYWENTLQPIINWIAKYIFPVVAPVVEKVVQVVLDGIGAMITIIGDIIVWIIDFVTECVQMSADVGKAFGILKDFVIEHCTRLWNKAKEIWNALGGDIKTVVQNLKQMAIDKFIEIKNKVIEKCQELKQKAKEKWEEIKTAIVDKIIQLKEKAVEKVKEIKQGIIEKFNELIQPIKDVFDGIWKHISPIIEKLKNAFNFKWKLPDIKLPKVNITKKTGLFGLEYPSFSVSWNAKGGIFDSPTIFNTNKGFQGVGEAGAEAILPLDTLWSEMSKNFDRQTQTLAKLNNNNNQQTTLVLQLDGREVARGTFRNAGDLARIGQLNLDWL
jgi:phage-related protein